MSKNNEEYFQLLWYALVRVHGEYCIQAFYVFQSSHISPWLRNHHQSWLNKPKRNGEPRKDGNLRLSGQEKMNYQEPRINGIECLWSSDCRYRSIG